MKVIKKEDESFESMGYRFKKQEKQERFGIDVNKNRFYIKPSTIARKKKKRAEFEEMVRNKRRNR